MICNSEVITLSITMMTMMMMILGQSLTRVHKTRDPERDSEPNELVADAFRAGLCLSSYPLLAKTDVAFS